MATELTAKIGTIIRTRRKAQGLTLKAFAPRAGLAFQNLWSIETGKAVATMPRLELISAALGIELSTLIALAETHGTNESRPVFVRVISSSGAAQ